MTTIAAVQGDGWAVVGVDSQASEEYRRYSLGERSAKLVENGPYLLAAAGDMRAINILAHVLSPPSPPPTATALSLDRFISSKFVPALRACFSESGYGRPDGSESSVVAVVNGTIYEIGGDFAWLNDVRGVYGAGTGGDFASAVLRHLSYDTPVKDRTVRQAERWVQRSLLIASELDAYTSPPFVVKRQDRKVKAAVKSKQ